MTDNTSPSLTLHLGRLPWIDRASLAEEITSLQDVIFEDKGVLIPLPRIQENTQIAENAFQLEINGTIHGPFAAIGDHEFWLNLSLDDLERQEWWAQTWRAREAIEPNWGTPATIVEGDDNARQLWVKNEYDTLNPTDYIVFFTAAELRKRASELLNSFLVEHYLAQLDEQVPALIRAVRECFDTETLRQHLVNKLSAGESIRDMPTVLENLLVGMPD